MTKTTAPVLETLPAEPAPAPVSTTPANGFAITALVLGITGIALGQGLLSIGAVVFGFVSRSKEPGARLMANWGLVLGFVGLFGGLLLGLMGLAAFAPFWLMGGIGEWDLWNF